MASQEGRKPRARSYSCAEPLLDGEGIRWYLDTEKCTLIAGYFERRFSVPELLPNAQPSGQTSTTAGTIVELDKPGVITARPRGAPRQTAPSPQTLVHETPGGALSKLRTRGGEGSLWIYRRW